MHDSGKFGVYLSPGLSGCGLYCCVTVHINLAPQIMAGWYKNTVVADLSLTAMYYALRTTRCRRHNDLQAVFILPHLPMSTGLNTALRVLRYKQYSRLNAVPGARCETCITAHMAHFPQWRLPDGGKPQFCFPRVNIIHAMKYVITVPTYSKPTGGAPRNVPMIRNCCHRTQRSVSRCHCH